MKTQFEKEEEEKTLLPTNSSTFDEYLLKVHKIYKYILYSPVNTIDNKERSLLIIAIYIIYCSYIEMNEQERKIVNKRIKIFFDNIHPLMDTYLFSAPEIRSMFWKKFVVHMVTYFNDFPPESPGFKIAQNIFSGNIPIPPINTILNIYFP